MPPSARLKERREVWAALSGANVAPFFRMSFPISSIAGLAVGPVESSEQGEQYERPCCSQDLHRAVLGLLHSPALR